MKRYITIMLPVVAVLLIGLHGLADMAQANTQIQLNDIKLTGQNASTSRQAISNSPIELVGPKDEITFYYELISNASGNNNQLVLQLSHSELLIAPSSVTIRIDEDTITSKPLTGKNSKQQLILPLSGKSLEKGIHSVTVVFDGFIKEGVCVQQGTSANWLMIGIGSYFQLNGQTNEDKPSLMDYPTAFAGSNKNVVSLVLPDKASTSTLNSGLTVAAYLAQQSNTEDSIQIIRESNVTTIPGNVIFLGSMSEFSTPFVKNILQRAALPTDKQSLILSRHELVNGANQVEALIATAYSPEVLEKRVSLLTNDYFTKQLSGRQMSIKNVPHMKKTINKKKVSLKKFGIQTIMLDVHQGQSQHFFYQAPITSPSHNSPTLQLRLKRSETIAPKEKAEETVLNEEIELVILVNGLPHSVDIRALTNEENNVFTVNVPIEAGAIKENRLMDIQFVANGLSQQNPCVSTDENRWIYVLEDSFFIFPEGEEKQNTLNTLAAYPFPFIDSTSPTAVVLPENVQVSDKQLLQLYLSMSMNGQAPRLTLKTATEVKTDDLKKKHVIFIGGPAVQPLLNDKKEDLTVSYKGAIPQLSKLGFISEAVQSFNWTQPSLWNQKEHTMLVFDRNTQSAPFIDKRSLDFLTNTEETATIAVKTNHNQLFTNAVQLEETLKEETEIDQNSKELPFSIWWITGYIALLISMILLIFYMKRKRKE